MSSSAKYAKYNSAVDSIISIIRRSYFGKKVDEEFLIDLKSLMENKIVATGVMERAADPMEPVSVLNTELECLPLPNEILVKIFGYLDIQDISRSARVSHQFNMISKDSSLWKSWGKLCIYKRKVSTEFLTYIIQRGITELSLSECEILPPRVKLSQPLNLKTLKLEAVDGNETLVNEILTSHSMEEIDFRISMISENTISEFIQKLPQIGNHLKTLNLESKLKKCGNLGTIALIVNSCPSLEELNLCGNTLTNKALDYLCKNLTPNILKLNLEIGSRQGLDDKNIRALVKRCPNLKTLDIRSNEKVTFQGLVAISDRLHFLEYLGLPESIGDELGLFENINWSKMCCLKSMKNLKELLIGDDDIWDIIGDEYQGILKREIPHLRKHNGGQINQACDYDLEVAMKDTEDYKGIKFCPICFEYENGNYFWSQHEC